MKYEVSFINKETGKIIATTSGDTTKDLSISVNSPKDCITCEGTGMEPHGHDACPDCGGTGEER